MDVNQLKFQKLTKEQVDKADGALKAEIARVNASENSTGKGTLECFEVVSGKTCIAYVIAGDVPHYKDTEVSSAFVAEPVLIKLAYSGERVYIRGRFIDTKSAIKEGKRLIIED